MLKFMMAMGVIGWIVIAGVVRSPRLGARRPEQRPNPTGDHRRRLRWVGRVVLRAAAVEGGSREISVTSVARGLVRAAGRRQSAAGSANPRSSRAASWSPATAQPRTVTGVGPGNEFCYPLMLVPSIPRVYTPGYNVRICYGLFGLPSVNEIVTLASSEPSGNAGSGGDSPSQNISVLPVRYIKFWSSIMRPRIVPNV